MSWFRLPRQALPERGLRQFCGWGMSISLCGFLDLYLELAVILSEAVTAPRALLAGVGSLARPIVGIRHLYWMRTRGWVIACPECKGKSQRCAGQCVLCIWGGYKYSFSTRTAP